MIFFGTLVCQNRQVYKKSALAHPIFTLDGRFQLFLSAFDVSVIVVPLKVAIWLKKIDFWAFQKIIPEAHLMYTCLFWCNKVLKNQFSLRCAIKIKSNRHNLMFTYLFWHTKVPKNQFLLTQWQFLMVPQWCWHQKMKKPLKPPI